MSLYFSPALRLSAVLLLMTVATPFFAAVHEYDLPDHGHVRAEILSIDEDSVTLRIADTGEQVEVPASDFRRGYFEFLKLRHKLEQDQEQQALSVEDLLKKAQEGEGENVDSEPAADQFRLWRLSEAGKQRIGRDSVEARLIELVTGQIKLEDRRGNIALLSFSDLAPAEMQVLQDWFLQNRAGRMAWFALEARPLIRDEPPTAMPGLPLADLTDPADPEQNEGPYSLPEGKVHKTEYGWFEIHFTSRAPLPLEDIKAVVHVVKRRNGPGVDSFFALENTWTEERMTEGLTPFRTHGIPLGESTIQLEDDRNRFLLPREYDESLTGIVVKVYAGEKLIHLHVEPRALFNETEWETPYPLENPQKIVLPMTSGEAEVLKRSLPEPKTPVAPPGQ